MKDENQNYVSIVQWLTLLHIFIQQNLNSFSAQILLVACHKLAMVRISYNFAGWKQGLTTYAGQSLKTINHNHYQEYITLSIGATQLVFICSKLTKVTLEQGVKYVQSY